MGDEGGTANVKCLGCGGRYRSAGQPGLFECVDCGDELEQTETLSRLSTHRAPLEEIAESSATDAHVARVVLAALDGAEPHAEDVRRLVGPEADR